MKQNRCILKLTVVFFFLMFVLGGRSFREPTFTAFTFPAWGINNKKIDNRPTKHSNLISNVTFCWPLFTVLSAGFSTFVYWKLAVHGLHNLRPCTGFLFPVYSRSYYGLCTPSFFYLSMYCTFPVDFLGAGILQRICLNSDVLSVYRGRIIFSTFFNLSYIVWYGHVDRASFSHAVDPSLNIFSFTRFFR